MQRTVFSLIIICLIACLFPIAAGAQEDEEYTGPLFDKSVLELLKSSAIIRPPKPEEYTVDNINQFWREAQELFQAGEYEKSYEKLNLINQVKLQNGIRNLPSLSYAVILESQRAIQHNKPEIGYRLAQHAQKLSPNFSFPHIALANAGNIAKGGIRGTIAKFNEYQLARLTIFRNFFESLDFYVNLSSMLAIAFYFSCTVFAVIILFKNFRLLKHNLTHLFKGKLLPVIITALVIIVLFLPLLFNMGLLWLLIIWFFIFGGYISNKEKLIPLSFFVSLAILPFLLNLVFSTALTVYNSPVKAIVHVNESKPDKYIEMDLFRWHAEEPQNKNLVMCLARTYRMEGKSELAENFYQQLIEKSDLKALAFNNLGNIYFYRGYPTRAANYYKKAIESDDRLASAYYNLGRVYYNKLDFQEGEKQIKKAEQLSSHKIRTYSELNQNSDIHIQIDENLPNRFIWERLLRPDKNKSEVYDNFLSGFFKIVPTRYLFILSAFLVISYAYLFLIRKNDWAQTCINCGKPVCKKCMTKPPEDLEYCLHCHRIYVEKMEIDPHIKIEKRKQISQYQSRKMWVTVLGNILLPGVGNLYQGKTFIGFVVLFLFSFFVTKIIWWNGIFFHLGNTYQLKTFSTLIFFIFLMAIIYIFNIWIGHKKSR